MTADREALAKVLMASVLIPGPVRVTKQEAVVLTIEEALEAADALLAAGWRPAAPESRDAQSGVEEELAEALSWTSGEMTRYSETAHPDHNRWSWRGDGHGETIRDQFREQARHLAAALESLIAGERAKAVEAVTREWQFGGWTILTLPVPASANRVIALGQRVTDWLRERADREQP